MSPRRPNILHLFSDQQRADTIAALGNPILRTPVLDRLVREGVAFTDCTTPSPVCVPARCSMHYGVYPTKTGCAKNVAMMEHNDNAIPDLLGRQGYRTMAIGKCHFLPNLLDKRGYQARLTQEEGKSDPEIDDYVRFLVENDYDDYECHGARAEMFYLPQISSLPEEAHPTTWISDRSIEFIREASAGDQPWMLFCSNIHPHPPFAPPKPWHKLYRTPDMPTPMIPPDADELLTWVNRKQNHANYRDRGFDESLARTIKAYYYATISFLDYQIGRVIEALEETGQLDNTLILFTSDHGEYLGDYRSYAKRSMHDAACRVPMIVRYPERFAPGTTCADPVSLVDVLPTFAAATGAPTDDLPLDGADLAAVARDGASGRALFSQFGRREEATYMLLNSEWKYFYSVPDRKAFLFNRTADPHDTHNLADDPSSADRADEMKRELLAFLKRENCEEAFVEKGDRLDWREWPQPDESYLDDPTERVNRQEYPSYELDRPGYTD